jgi:hypothetical protein
MDIKTKEGRLLIVDDNKSVLKSALKLRKSNLPLHLQSKLLNVLQNRVVIPIGCNEEHPVDIRLISTTNKNLLQMIQPAIENLIVLLIVYKRLYFTNIIIHVPVDK